MAGKVKFGVALFTMVLLIYIMAPAKLLPGGQEPMRIQPLNLAPKFLLKARQFRRANMVFSLRWNLKKPPWFFQNSIQPGEVFITILHMMLCGLWCPYKN